MADHCGPALESRAACALALVRCAAARVRSRVGRHPHDPCGHPAREEHALPARTPRTSGESRPVRGTAAHRMQRGSRAGGQGGGRAGKLTQTICRACPNCPWTPTSGRATRSTPAGATCRVSASAALFRGLTCHARIRCNSNNKFITFVRAYVVCTCRWAPPLLPQPPCKGRRSRGGCTRVRGAFRLAVEVFR